MTDAPMSESGSPRAYSAEESPPVHAGWAVASLLFFWPLAFAAFNHAFNVYPLWARGDVVAAKAASDRVRRLGQLSLCLAGGLMLLLAVGYTALLIALIANGGDGPFYHHRHDGWMSRDFDN